VKRSPVAGAFLVLVLAGCAGPAPTATGSASSDVESPAGAATATDADGRYTLTFSLPKASYAAREEIIGGLATLGLEPGPDVVVGGSRDLLSFGFAEVNGTRQMGPASDSMCARHALSAASPLTSRIVKSGGWRDDMPDSDFYFGFFADPAIKLPPGDWDITAYADFVEGPGCSGETKALKATIRVHVTDAPASSS